MVEILSLIIAYLIGSINSAVLVSKYLKLPDPRTRGSGNPGATNILRTIGTNQALVVLLADALKGVLAVLIARIFGVHGFVVALAGLASVVGHVFPIFFKFKGGKGVATLFGATLMLSFWVWFVMLIVWLALAFLLRYASLASVAASVCAPLFSLIFGHYQYVLPLLLAAALVIWRHWDNIDRLRKGTEVKMNLNFLKRKSPIPPSSSSS